MKRTNISLLLLLLIAACVSLLLYTRADTLNAAAAQEATTTPETTMQTLLERLQARILAEPAFRVSIWFVNPPVPGEPAWEIPSTLEGGGTRQLSEIGSSYVCFVEQGQTYNDSVCIPYTNLRMVTYSN